MNKATEEKLISYIIAVALAAITKYGVPAAKTRAKWLAAGMRSLKVVGRHEFFTELKR